MAGANPLAGRGSQFHWLMIWISGHPVSAFWTVGGSSGSSNLRAAGVVVGCWYCPVPIYVMSAGVCWFGADSGIIATFAS